MPRDHADPAGPRLALYYELGAPFDPGKPTVLVVADGQQFYVRRGAIARLQSDEFGDAFNVVGVVGRGATPEFVRASLDAAGRPDWKRAWTLFRSEQWIGDLDAVRRELVGPSGRILLYGASGGGWLAHQYLARHGAYVRRAFTACPVDPFSVGDLRLRSDRFWEEIGAHDPALRPLVKQALERYSSERAAAIMTLQRQNFFVQPARLAVERAALIRTLASGNEDGYAAARREYQVEEVRAFFASDEGIPVRVRLFELFQPSGGVARLRATEEVQPDLENQRNFAAPLLDLLDRGRIAAPAFDRPALHRLETEVFILAGRRDHTVDYRAAIALAASYPRSVLFLADDDHMFAGMKDDGTRDLLLRTFLRDGSSAAAFRAALERAAPHRWQEP